MFWQNGRGTESIRYNLCFQGLQSSWEKEKWRHLLSIYCIPVTVTHGSLLFYFLSQNFMESIIITEETETWRSLVRHGVGTKPHADPGAPPLNHHLLLSFWVHQVHAPHCTCGPGALSSQGDFKNLMKVHQVSTDMNILHHLQKFVCTSEAGYQAWGHSPWTL